MEKIESIYSEEFSLSEWDEEERITKYYKRVPIHVSEEEYEEIKKYAYGSVSSKKENKVAVIIKIYAILFILIGLIGGVAFGISVESFITTVVCWITSFFCGMLIYSISEAIQLLEDIKNK